MKDLQARLSRLSSDVAQIEDELKTAAAQEPSGPTVEICNEAVLSAAKSAVDRLRHLLWPYVQAAARQTTGVDEMIQRYRMERVTTLLHDLTDPVTAPRLAALPEAQSFFSSIQEIATTAVEKHLQRAARQPFTRTLASPKRKSYLN